MKVISIAVFTTLALIGADQLLTYGRYSQQVSDMARSIGRGFGVL